MLTYLMVPHKKLICHFHSQKQEHSESTVALDGPQSQAYEDRSPAFYGQDRYRSERNPPPPYGTYLTRRESSHGGSSQEHHRDDRGRRSVLHFRSVLQSHHASDGASSDSGEYDTVVPSKGKELPAIQIERTEKRIGGEKRDASRCKSRERGDGGVDGEEGLVGLVRNKVKKEGLVDLVLTVKKEYS